MSIYTYLGLSFPDPLDGDTALNRKKSDPFEPEHENGFKIVKVGCRSVKEIYAKFATYMKGKIDGDLQNIDEQFSDDVKRLNRKYSQNLKNWKFSQVNSFETHESSEKPIIKSKCNIKIILDEDEGEFSSISKAYTIILKFLLRQTTFLIEGSDQYLNLSEEKSDFDTLDELTPLERLMVRASIKDHDITNSTLALQDKTGSLFIKVQIERSNSKNREETSFNPSYFNFSDKKFFAKLCEEYINSLPNDWKHIKSCFESSENSKIECGSEFKKRPEDKSEVAKLFENIKKGLKNLSKEISSDVKSELEKIKEATKKALPLPKIKEETPIPTDPVINQDELPSPKDISEEDKDHVVCFEKEEVVEIEGGGKIEEKTDVVPNEKDPKPNEKDPEINKPVVNTKIKRGKSLASTTSKAKTTKKGASSLDDDTFMNRIIDKKNEKQKEIENKNIALNWMIKELINTDDEKFYERCVDLLGFCLKSENWEDLLQKAFVSLRKTELTWFRFNTINSAVAKLIKFGFESTTISSSKVCKMVFYFSYLFPVGQEPYCNFGKSTQPAVNGSLLSARYIFNLAVQKGYFAENRELEAAFNQYFGADIDFSKYTLKTKDHTAAVKLFVMELMNAHYSKGVNPSSINLALDMLLSISEDYEGKVDFKPIVKDLIQALKSFKLEFRVQTLTRFYEIYDSLPDSNTSKQDVYKILYEHVFSLVCDQAFSNKNLTKELPELISNLIKELHIYEKKSTIKPKECLNEKKSKNKTKESALKPKECSNDKILEGIETFAYPKMDKIVLRSIDDIEAQKKMNEIRKLSAGQSDLLFQYLDVPMEVDLFKECYKKVLESCVDFPFFLNNCPKNESRLLLGEFFGWLKNLDTGPYEMVFKGNNFRAYANLLMVCLKILKKKEVVNNETLSESYRSLYSIIEGSFISEFHDKLTSLFPKKAFLAFEKAHLECSEEELSTIIKNIPPLKTVCTWISKYQNLMMSTLMCRHLEKMIEDVEKKQIALNAWVELLRAEFVDKRIFTPEVIEDHIESLLSPQSEDVNEDEDVSEGENVSGDEDVNDALRK